MKKILLAVSVFITLLTATVVLPVSASAAVPGACKKSIFLGFPTWFEYLEIGPNKGDPCAIIGPEDNVGKNDATKVNLDFGRVGGLIGLAVVDILLRLAGLIAVGAVIYGGIRLVLSEGEPDKFKQAKGTVFAAIIGLLIVLVATALVNLVGGTLLK